MYGSKREQIRQAGRRAARRLASSLLCAPLMQVLLVATHSLHCEQVNGKDVSLAKEPFDPDLSKQSRCLSSPTTIMSESHFDEYEHYNYDQDKAMFSGHSGKQRSKKEAEQNTNRYSRPVALRYPWLLSVSCT